MRRRPARSRVPDDHRGGGLSCEHLNCRRRVERYRKVRLARARRDTFGSAEGGAAISSRDNVARRGSPRPADWERLDSRERTGSSRTPTVRPAGAGRSADRCPALTIPWPARSRDCRSQTDARDSRSHSSSSRGRGHPSRGAARSNCRRSHPGAVAGREGLPRPNRGSSSRPAEPARRPRILPPRPSYWSSRAGCTSTTPATRAPRRGPGGRGLSSSQTPVGTSRIYINAHPGPKLQTMRGLSPANPKTGPPGPSDS